MKIQIIIFFSYLVLLTKSDETNLRTYPDPEINMNTGQVIKWYGYPFENHEVITEDGYILALHRIPFGINNTAVSNRPVVLLQHGLLDSSFSWVCNTPDESFAFILADKGYDVWMANSRGNVYSKRHVTHSTNSNSFWNFSWDEMAKYDLPASIDYILNITKSEKLSYVGHSQGTLIAFAKFGIYSELNSKISSIVAFAPVVYLGHIRSGVRFLAYADSAIHLFYKIVNSGEFLPSDLLKKMLAEYVCGHEYTSFICQNILFLLAGYSTENLDKTRLPIYLAHCPAGTSSKNMVQFSQAYKSNEFKMYDYGFIRNMYYYYSIASPKYHLSTHGIPVAMFWGGNDWLAVDRDVKRAITELGEDVQFKKFINKYNHMDFIWGKDAADVIYPEAIDFISKYD